MKPLLFAFPALLFGLCCSSLHAQEVPTKWDVEIPEKIADGTPSPPTPKPPPLDLKVVSSHTKRTEVTLAPEMPGLPPITGTINLTTQLVEDPNLVDPLPPLPDLPPTDPAVLARLAELRERFQKTTLVFLSATVYNQNRTFLRIYPNGKVDQKVEAWSNLNFNHFSGFSTYRVKDGVDGSFYKFGLLMGVGSMDTHRMAKLAAEKGFPYKAPDIPDIPDLAVGGPAFVVTKGAPESPARDTLEQIHDLYRKEGTRMEAAYHARIKAYEDRKAYLLTNPTKPEDVTIQFWKRKVPSPQGVQAIGEGVKP